MATLTIELPDSVLADSGRTREEFVQEAKFLLAAKLFDLGRLSSGRAAELCGMSRVDFLESLGAVGVSTIQLTPEELVAEVAAWSSPDA